ncbi:hypothetical protein BDN71DRAFT_1435746 [Pleurotus eryngii]|uniref:Uncharacterized protein n=1 Tax=Pleurotus eryngii TaxID=5323 RepID=A0A9P5ZJL4_PLEER|nr:hypothetical protein BDN71DRAFT_1435746 [Pleurotus eryngii]
MHAIFEAMEHLHNVKGLASVINNAYDTMVDKFFATAPDPMSLEGAAPRNSHTVTLPQLLTDNTCHNSASFGWLNRQNDSSLPFGWLDMESTGASTLPSTSTSSAPSGLYKSFSSVASRPGNTATRQSSFEKFACLKGCRKKVGGQAWHLQWHLQLEKCTARHSLHHQQSKENQNLAYQYEELIPTVMQKNQQLSTSAMGILIGGYWSVDPTPAVRFDLDGAQGLGCPSAQ